MQEQGGTARRFLLTKGILPLVPKLLLWNNCEAKLREQLRPQAEAWGREVNETQNSNNIYGWRLYR